MKSKIIAEFLENNGIAYEIFGDTDSEVAGFSSIYKYKENTVSWLRYAKTMDEVEANSIALLITGNDTPDFSNVKCQIKVNDPRAVFFMTVDNFWGEKPEYVISPKAEICEGAKLGKNVAVGPFTYISPNAEIGNDCIIGANVTIKGKVKIGDRCVIQSGAVIGEDGFAFTKENNKLTFVKHYGGVQIGDDVSIGSQTCIVRGTIDDTILENMVKIDNLCHIAHNVRLGERVEIVAGSVVMGSVHIGNDSWIATSMIRDQRHVGDHAIVGMGAVVVKDVESNVTVAGNPAKPFERKEKI